MNEFSTQSVHSPQPAFARVLTSDLSSVYVPSSPELLAAQTTTNLLSLLLAPVKAYHSVLTLLAVPAYEELLIKQPLLTRVSIGQAVIASLLRSNTRIRDVDDVNGVLQLCQDLVKDAPLDDRPSGSSQLNKPLSAHHHTAVAEEQGWLARIIHLFVAEDTTTHLAVSIELFGCASVGVSLNDPSISCLRPLGATFP
jgi:hypothetical protein